MLHAAVPTSQVPQPAGSPEPRRGPRVLAVTVAVLATLGVHLSWHLFVNTVAGQRVDRLAFEGAQRGQNTLWSVAEPVLDVVSIAFVVVAIGGIMTLALLRRRWFLALQVAVLVGGANATTQLLKYVIYDRPALLPGWTGQNSLPSGHTTVAASVAAALLLACPRAWRPGVAVFGALWTATTGLSTLVGQWHRPSDVVAAVFVALVWAAGACAMTSPKSLDVPDRPGGTLRSHRAGLAVLGLGLGGLVSGAVAVIALLDLGTQSVHPPFEGEVTAYAGGVAGVVAVSALAFAVLLVVRQATATPRSA